MLQDKLLTFKSIGYSFSKKFEQEFRNHSQNVNLLIFTGITRKLKLRNQYDNLHNFQFLVYLTIILLFEYQNLKIFSIIRLKCESIFY